VLRERVSRGGSAFLHEGVRVGDKLLISEPRNTFPLRHREKTVLLAGGIGITPLLSMAKHLADAGSPFTMHYCARSIEKAAFCSELRMTPFASKVHYHFDDGAPEQRFDLEKSIGPPTSDTDLYVCGPAGFIEFVQAGAKRAGFLDAQVHVEHFGAHVPSGADDRPFTIEIASTGQKVVVPADQTAVQALAAAGIDVLTSCEQGFCGTCVTRVLAGRCDHRDICLSPEERERAFTPCCSRASTPVLVLDL
jgi:vanillate O-demethylase ferredoxin subunit